MVEIQSGHDYSAIFKYIFFLKAFDDWMRDKPAVTGIGCMNKVKMAMMRIKKERVILAIPNLCLLNAETRTL